MNFIFEKNNSSIYFYIFFSLILHIVFVCLSIFFINYVYVNKILENKTVRVTITQAPQKNNVVTPKVVPKKILREKVIKKVSPTKEIVPLKENILPQTPTQSNEPQVQNPPQDQNEIEPAVNEALVDVAARCNLPNVSITPDAANAGVTSGKIILEVEILESGNIQEARILKGTGYNIDEEVVTLAKKMKCTPALKDGKPVSVIKRLQWNIMY